MKTHTKSVKHLALGLLLSLVLFLLTPGLSLGIEALNNKGFEPPADNYRQAITLLKSQKKSNSREFRQIKRQLGIINETMRTPGLTEILGGIGYIIGLFGLSYYWYARNLLAKRS